MIDYLVLAGIATFAVILVVLITLLIWNKPVFVIYIQVGYCFFVRFLTIQIGIPEVIKYFFDYLTLILLLQIILHANKTKNINIRKPLFFIVLFIVVTIISTIYNNSDFVLFFWGVRLNFRFYIFFLACVFFLKRNDIDNILNFFMFMLPLNTILVIYQYFIMDLRFDYVGGFFGTHVSSHSEQVPFLILVNLIAIVFYVESKINLVQMILYLGMIMFTAAIAEIKILYILLPIFVILVSILSFPNIRSVQLIIISVIFIPISFSFMLILYPEWVSQLGNIRLAIFNTAVDEYGDQGALGRLTAGSYLLKNIIIEPFQRIFGIGFGNADHFMSYSSSFLDRYETLNYNIFRYTVVMIELGIVGLVVYCLFFFIIATESLRIRKVIDKNYSYYCHISFITSLLVFFLIVYNPTLSMEGAFIIFIILSFPFIMEKDKYEIKYISSNIQIKNAAIQRNMA